MRSVKNIKLDKNSTIKDALKVISDGDFQIALLTDHNEKLLGTITDGDIRRGLLKGFNLNSPINSIIFKKPTSVSNNLSREKVIKIAIAKKIYQLPVVDEGGKVIGIHILNELLKKRKKNNKVIIMAGGKGTRLMPLTKNKPKPMLLVGKKPILQIQIENFAKNGYKDFTICINYKSKIIQDYFKDGSKFGVKINYILEKKRMGTAGALSLLKIKPTKPFFIINGDLITNLDFEKMLDFHYESKAQATMCVSEYNIESRYGEVELNNENIVNINEKPTHKFFVNAGMYILDPTCIDLVPNDFYDMPNLFKKIIDKKKKAVSFPLGEYWIDIGVEADYKKANYEYKNKFIIR